MIPGTPLLFALEATGELGEKVSTALDLPLSEHEERGFEDGEHKVRPLVSVRGRDVFVLQSLHGGPDESPNDKLCRLLFFVGALKDAAAARVTVIAPYLCYSRKDRKTKSRDPVTTRYVASLFEAVGTDCLVTLDVHNLAAFQNAFRCRTEHLEAKNLFLEHFLPLLAGEKPAVVSPDAGGVKRADAFRDALSEALQEGIPMIFLEKQRSEGAVSGEAVVGEVEGRTVIVLDDLVSTGTTLVRAASACRERGAVAVYAAATHGLFMEGATELFAGSGIERVVVTDSVPPFRAESPEARDKLVVLEVAPLLSEAIERLHDDGSIVDLLGS